MFDIATLAEELADAARDATGVGQSILVAGQALAFWGTYYLDDEYPLERQQALASEDIDLFDRRKARVIGYIEALREVANRHGGKLSDPEFAGWDDNSVSLAIMEMTHPELPKPLTIDVLHQLGGLEGDEIEKGADLITVGRHSFPVLNPCLCLKARIHNLLWLYPKLGKSQARMEVEVLRVRSAIDIARHYLADIGRYETTEHRKKYQKKIQLIARMGRQSRIGPALYGKYRIDIHDVFDGLSIDERFRAQTIEPARARYRERHPDLA